MELRLLLILELIVLSQRGKGDIQHYAPLLIMDVMTRLYNDELSLIELDESACFAENVTTS